MKPSTIRKRLQEVVNDGLVHISEKVKEEGIPENMDICSEAIEHLLSAKDLLLKLEKKRPKLAPPKRVRKGRVNNVSLRVWKRDDYTCQVCGLRDEDCKELARASLVAEAEELDDYITICKNHMKELKTLKPWKTRTSRKATIDVLIEMAKGFDNSGLPH